MVFSVKEDVQNIFNKGSKKHTRTMEFKIFTKIRYKYPNTDIYYYLTSTQEEKKHTTDRPE